MTTIQVILVEDHQVVRQGLRLLIESNSDIRVIGEASDGLEAIDLIQELQPDLVVFDISMPNLNGIMMVKKLRQLGVSTKLLALTANEDRAYLTELVSLGVNGYLLKRSAANELIDAIRATYKNQKFLDREIVTDLVEGVFSGSGKKSVVADGLLSDRETEIIRLIAVGYTNKEVASQLKISVKTVETHKARAMAKLQLESRAELMRYAVKNGWLDVSP